MIDHLRHDGASGPSHRRRHTLVDAADRFADDQSLLSMGEKQHDFRSAAAFRQWTIDDMLHFALHHRDRRDLLGAHVIQPTHGRKRVTELGLM